MVILPRLLCVLVCVDCTIYCVSSSFHLSEHLSRAIDSLFPMWYFSFSSHHRIVRGYSRLFTVHCTRVSLVFLTTRHVLVVFAHLASTTLIGSIDPLWICSMGFIFFTTAYYCRVTWDLSPCAICTWTLYWSSTWFHVLWLIIQLNSFYALLHVSNCFYFAFIAHIVRFTVRDLAGDSDWSLFPPQNTVFITIA